MITRPKKVPYSKNLNLREIADDLSLCWLYFGANAWKAKDDINDRSVLLPPDENPADYDWRFTKGQFVMAKAIGFSEIAYRKRLASHILRDGAKQIDFFLPMTEIVISDTTFTIGTPHECYRRKC